MSIDKKISQFTDGGAIQTSDAIAAVRDGDNVRVYVGTAAAADIGAGSDDIPTNSMISGTVADSLQGTSDTSNTIDAGLLTFQTQSGKSFEVGRTLLITSVSDPVTLRMTGIVDDYYEDGGNWFIDINITNYSGSGEHDDWSIRVSGDVGPKGDTGDVGPAGTITDGDYGDITVGGGGTTMTVDAAAIDFSKMQSISSGTFLGRTAAGSGPIEALSASTMRSALDLYTTTETDAEISAAIGDLGALASLNTVGTTQIDNTSVTRQKVGFAPQESDVSSGSGTTTLAMDSGCFRKVTATGNITIDVTPPANSLPGGYVLQAVNFGAHTITWTGVDDWAAGVAPVLTSSGTDYIGFTADKNGNVIGYLIGKNFS